MANDPRFEVYPQTKRAFGSIPSEELTEPTGEYGWRFRAANGQVNAIGGEGFTREADAERAIMQFLTEVAKVPVLEIGDLNPTIMRVER